MQRWFVQSGPLAVLFLFFFSLWAPTLPGGPSELANLDGSGTVDEGEVVTLSASWWNDATWENGTRVWSDSDAADWVVSEGMRSPSLSRSNLTSWLFSDLFDDQSGGPPAGWSCDSVGGNTEFSGAMTSKADISSEYNAYCNHDLDGYLLNPDGQTTFHFRTWVRDGYEHEWRGARLYAVVDDERHFFMFVGDENGQLSLKSNYQQTNGDWVILDCPLGRSLIPQATLSESWHDWHILVDSDERRYWLYQDGVLRCEFGFSPVTNDGMGHLIEIGTHGSQSDTGWILYDQVAADAGWHTFHQGGEWTSRSIPKSPSYEWGTLHPNWEWWGIGTWVDDVQQGVRVDFLNAVTLQPITGYENLIPDGNGIDLSSLHHAQEVLLRVRWLDLPVDFIALDGVDYEQGELRPPDLVAQPIVFDPTSADEGLLWDDIPLSVHSDVLVKRLADVVDIRHQWTIDGIEFETSWLEVMTGTHRANASLGTLSAGIHTIALELDDTDEVSEEDEFNNRYVRDLPIHPSAGPNVTHQLHTPAGQVWNISYSNNVAGLQVESVLVDWGDGSTPELLTGEFVGHHTYTSEGEHVVSAYANLQDGLRSGWTNVSVNATGSEPVAVIHAEEPWPEMPGWVRFDCLQSFDPYLLGLHCEWGFGGTEAEVPTWFEGTAWLTHLDEMGSHQVLLRVTDARGGMNWTTHTHVIAQSSLVGALLSVDTSPHAPAEGEPFNLILHWNASLSASDIEQMRLQISISEEDLATTELGDGVHTLDGLEDAGIHVIEVVALRWIENEWRVVGLASTVVDIQEIPFEFEVLDPRDLGEGEHYVFELNVSGGLSPWEAVDISVTLTQGDDEWRIDDALLGDESDGVGLHSFVLDSPLLNVGPVDVQWTFSRDVNENGTARFQVFNDLPNFSLNCPSTVVVQEVLTCSIGNLSDTGDDLEDLRISWLWNGAEVDGEMQASITPPRIGTAELRVIVTDDDDASTEQSVQIEVMVEAGDDGTDLDLSPIMTRGLMALGILLILILVGTFVLVKSSGKNPGPGRRSDWDQNPWDAPVNQSDSFSQEQEP